MTELKIPGVVFSLDQCETIAKELTAKNTPREDIKEEMCDRPYALRRVLYFFDGGKPGFVQGGPDATS